MVCCMNRIDEQPEVDAGVREVPGTTDQESAYAGRLRPAVGRRRREERTRSPGTDRILRKQAAGTQLQTGTSCF